MLPMIDKFNAFCCCVIGSRKKRKLSDETPVTETGKQVDEMENTNTEELQEGDDTRQGKMNKSKLNPFKKKRHRKPDVKHRRPEDLKCPTCSRQFTAFKYLKLHMRKHNNPCDQCTASFNSQAALQVYNILKFSIK